MSDHNEDQWILSQFPPDFKGIACEVGAGDGISASNTLLLEREGWDVLCIEPNPHYEERLKATRKRVEMCAAGSFDMLDHPFTVFKSPDGNEMSVSSLKPSFEVYKTWGQSAPGSIVWVTVRRLDGLLKEAGFDHLDALSIDTEGTELDVLIAANLDHWRPKVIVIELWPSTRHHIDGSLRLHGYELTEERGMNGLYVRGAKDGNGSAT